MLQSLQNKLAQIIAEEYELLDVSIPWEIPQDLQNGDRATPVSLQIAKRAGKSPRDVAEHIVSSLEDFEGIEKIEIAGPGYINVFFTASALISSLQNSLDACEPQKTRDEAPVIIEYSQPNIAKPLGIHHILTTVIGQVLVNLHRHLGYNTVSINHLGDWGTQFGQIAVAYEKWADKPLSEHSIDDLLALYVRFHAEAKDNEELMNEGREAFKKMEDGDSELRKFWSEVIEITMAELQKTYDQLGVSFDFTHGESFYEDKMTPIIEEGKKKGVFKEGERGALIAEFPEETHMPPAIVLKGDGATIYHTRDLATIAYRINKWHPQEILYVVDVAQKLYFEQLFAMVEQLEWDLPHLEHVVFGRMSFADKSMSTRKGNVLKLQNVLDESVQRAKNVIVEHGDNIQTDDTARLAEMMGRGAVVYGILSQNRKMDITFDWDRILSFDGNSAPYVQYTHARATSILEKANFEGVNLSVQTESLSQHERGLVNLLLRFSDILEDARTTHMPHVLCNYLYSLCQQFNTFYGAEPILKASDPQRALRLTLTSVTATVLKTSAEILTVQVPDRM